MSPPIAQLGHPALAAPIQNLELGMGIPASEGAGTKKVNDLTNSGVYFSLLFFFPQTARSSVWSTAPWTRRGFPLPKATPVAFLNLGEKISI